MSLPFEILHQKIIYTNHIKPENIPAIRDCKTKVIFCNTAPKPGFTILFAGCDYRKHEHLVPVEKRKGRLFYNDEFYQYAYTLDK